MSNFEAVQLTSKGKNLLAKAQAGVELKYTRIVMGDGELGGSAIDELNQLKNEVKSLTIEKEITLPGGKAVVGGSFTNQGETTGFYWRELGIFAQDPDVGEILYCYGNSGGLAEYIPPDGGTNIIERSVDLVMIVGNAQNITASIEQSLIYVKKDEFDALIQVSIGSTPPAITRANDLWFKLI